MKCSCCGQQIKTKKVRVKITDAMLVGHTKRAFVRGATNYQEGGIVSAYLKNTGKAVLPPRDPAFDRRAA